MSTDALKINLPFARSSGLRRLRRPESSPRRSCPFTFRNQKDRARLCPKTSTCARIPPSKRSRSYPTPFREGGTVTAGNASGINDGSCAMFVASEAAASRFGLTPIARVVGTSAAGVLPDLMGIGPIPAIQKLLGRRNLKIDEMDVVEVNEAFAAQALAVIRAFNLPDDCERVNPNGGAIALGHPLGMSGARLVLTAARQLQRIKGRYALASMCIGVGQGIAILLAQP